MTIENDFLDGIPVEPETVSIADALVPEPVPVAEPVLEPIPEPAPQPKADVGTIPISALLDEREKRKDLERRIAQFEQERAQQVTQIPDQLSDPQGYNQHQMQQMQQTMLDNRLNMSETGCRRHYGDDLTDKAKEWAVAKFGTNTAFQSEVLGNADPYDYAIKAFQRDQIASTVTSDDFTAFQAWKSAQAQIATAPADQASPVTSSAPIPRSIVSVPSAGGGVAHQPTDPDAAFAGAFPG